MSHEHTEFLEIVLEVPEEAADAASGLAMHYGAQGVEVRDADTWVEGQDRLPAGRAEVRTWLSPDTDVEAFASAVTSRVEGPVNVRTSRVPAEDWVAKVRAQFQPVRLGRRVRVRASWHPSEAGPEDVEIELDPGLAFGTGQHATTALCVEAVEASVEAARREGRTPAVLDVGTGSGVLCIVAARLGARPCVGIDNDPMAVQVAAENAELNGTAEACRFTTDPPEVVGGQWDLVLANIQLGVLTRLAPDIAPRVKPGGELYLSGLLEEQAAEAEAVYRDLGLTPGGSRLRDGWAVVRLTRPA